jgi:hypothetical protein
MNDEKRNLLVGHSMQSLRSSVTSKLKPNFGYFPPVSGLQNTKGATASVHIPSRSFSTQGDVQDWAQKQLTLSLGGLGEIATPAESLLVKSESLGELQKPRLRSGPEGIEKWTLPNTWAPRVAQMRRDVSDSSLCVTLATSQTSSFNVRFRKRLSRFSNVTTTPLTNKTQKQNCDWNVEESPIRLVKFDRALGSRVYSSLFNT